MKEKGSSAAHSKLVRECCEELALWGFVAWPNRTGAAFRDGQLIPFGKKGSGDIIAIFPFKLAGKLYGIHGEIECKTGDANQSKRQKAHMRAVRNSGAIYFTVWSRDDLRQELATRGFTRRDFAFGAAP